MTEEITIKVESKAGLARCSTTALVNGQYCQLKQSLSVRSPQCQWLVYRFGASKPTTGELDLRPRCWIFGELLESDGEKPKRCQACLDAEKESLQ